MGQGGSTQRQRELRSREHHRGLTPARLSPEPDNGCNSCNRYVSVCLSLPRLPYPYVGRRLALSTPRMLGLLDCYMPPYLCPHPEKRRRSCETGLRALIVKHWRDSGVTASSRRCSLLALSFSRLFSRVLHHHHANGIPLLVASIISTGVDAWPGIRILVVEHLSVCLCICLAGACASEGGAGVYLSPLPEKTFTTNLHQGAVTNTTNTTAALAMPPLTSTSSCSRETRR